MHTLLTKGCSWWPQSLSKVQLSDVATTNVCKVDTSNRNHIERRRWMKWLITGLRQKKYPLIWLHYESGLLRLRGQVFLLTDALPVLIESRLTPPLDQHLKNVTQETWIRFSNSRGLWLERHSNYESNTVYCNSTPSIERLVIKKNTSGPPFQNCNSRNMILIKGDSRKLWWETYSNLNFCIIIM